jgi:mannose-6-phosphate isomerase-like protein (cupin superfamily)
VSKGEHSRVSVVEELPRAERMPGHPAPAHIYLGPDDVEGLPIKVAAVDASQLVGKPLTELHRHDVEEIYLVVTPGLRFDVETDAETVSVRSPASVRIPAGTPHRFLVREAELSPCPLLGILVEPGR